jgi:hypothetical protein
MKAPIQSQGVWAWVSPESDPDFDHLPYFFILFDKDQVKTYSEISFVWFRRFVTGPKTEQQLTCLPLAPFKVAAKRPHPSCLVCLAKEQFRKKMLLKNQSSQPSVLCKTPEA